MDAPTPFSRAQYRQWFLVSMLPALVAYLAFKILGDWIYKGTPTCDIPEAKYLIAFTVAICLGYAAPMAYGTGTLLRRALPNLSFWPWVGLTTAQLTLVLTASVWVPICNPSNEPSTSLMFFDKPLLEAILFAVFIYVICYIVGAALGLLQGLLLRQSGAKWLIWVMGSGIGVGLGFVLAFLISDFLYLAIPTVNLEIVYFIQTMALCASTTVASAVTLRFMLRPERGIDEAMS